MASMARLYSRTDAGRQVWDAEDPRVPLDCRRVLGLVGEKTDAELLAAKLGWSKAAVEDILEELEQLGMVQSVAPDLDFTGKLLLEDLDFTGSLSVADLRAAQAKTRS
jgi:hypothetical protein